jgi:hypothetical protein
MNLIAMISLHISSLLLGLILSQTVHSAYGASAFASLRPARPTTPMERTSSVEGMDCSRAARLTTTRLLQSSGSGFGSKSVRKINPTPAPSPSSYEMFELQELRAQLQTILKQNILIQSLSKEKRQELSEYVKAVVEKIDSPIDFSGRRGNGNTMGTAKFVAAVEGKSWRMIFSTDGNSGTTSSGEGGADATDGALPYGSSVILRIGQFMGTEGTLDYVLKYSKQIMGLKELVAKSICSVDVSIVVPSRANYDRLQNSYYIRSHLLYHHRLVQLIQVSLRTNTKISKQTSLGSRIYPSVSSDCSRVG